ncbi:MAG: T9SS type A sorting domain-containing protein [Bacteroidota bacterium]
MQNLYPRVQLVCTLLLIAMLLAPGIGAQPTDQEVDTPHSAEPILSFENGNSFFSSTRNATDDPRYTPSCQSLSGKGVWFVFTVSETLSNLIALDTEGSDFDTILSVWRVSNGDLTEIACNDDGLPNRLSRIEESYARGLSYYVQVSGFQGQSGDLVLNVSPSAQLRPPYDAFGTWPFALPMLPGRSHPSNNANGAEDGEPSPSCVTGGGTNDDWRFFVPETSGFVTLDTFGSGFDTVLSVYRSNNGSLGDEVGCNDDGGTGDDLRNSRLLNLEVEAGVRYFVRVAGFRNDDFGFIRLNLSEVTAMPVTNEDEAAPDALVLDAAYPNPFATQTTLTYTLPTAQEARLVAYDLLGREVAVLVDGVQPAGTHEAALDAAGLPSGVYVVRLATEASARTQRVVVAR